MNRRAVQKWDKPLVQAALVLLTLALPRLALACPSCAGREGSGMVYGITIGAMILLPFPVVWFVIRLIRKHADS